MIFSTNYIAIAKRIVPLQMFFIKPKTNIWVLSINILIFALSNGVTISKHIELAFAFRNVCFGQPKCGNVLLIFRKEFYFDMKILEILINLRHT